VRLYLRLKGFSKLTTVNTRNHAVGSTLNALILQLFNKYCLEKKLVLIVKQAKAIPETGSGGP
jgi:hypothetical protein